MFDRVKMTGDETLVFVPGFDGVGSVFLDGGDLGIVGGASGIIGCIGSGCCNFDG